MDNRAPKQVIIGFDGKFSGPFNPLIHYMVSIGLVAVDENGKKLDSIRVSMAPPTIHHGFEQKCYKEFWLKPDMLALLKIFQSEALEPRDGMRAVISWIDLQIGRVGAENTTFVCDCTTDATWLDQYLTVFGGHTPLITYTGKYTGWPAVSDDFFRGVLGDSGSKWGVSDKVRAKFGIVGVPVGNHDPVADALEIAMTYALVVKAVEQMK